MIGSFEAIFTAKYWNRRVVVKKLLGENGLEKKRFNKEAQCLTISIKCFHPSDSEMEYPTYGLHNTFYGFEAMTIWNVNVVSWGRYIMVIAMKRMAAL